MATGQADELLHPLALALALAQPTARPHARSSWASVRTHLAKHSKLLQIPFQTQSLSAFSTTFNTSCAWRSHQPPPLSPLSVPSNAYLPWNAPSACLFTNPSQSQALHAVYSASHPHCTSFASRQAHTFQQPRPGKTYHRVCSDQR